MSRPRRNFDREFRDGAVRIVNEAGRPVAHIARELGDALGAHSDQLRTTAALGAHSDQLRTTAALGALSDQLRGGEQAEDYTGDGIPKLGDALAHPRGHRRGGHRVRQSLPIAATAPLELGELAGDRAGGPGVAVALPALRQRFASGGAWLAKRVRG